MTTAQMPLWLVDQLDADGILDKATRLTRKLKPRRCRQCGAQTLAALNDVGMATHVDPAQVTGLGEAIATLTGRATYATDHGDLYQRDRWHIRGRPADTHPVYAEHVCGAPVPSKPPPPNAAVRPDDPPF